MVQRFLNSIFLLLLIVSCKTYQNNITLEKIDSYPQLNYSEISWGDCMRYEKPYVENDSIITIDYVNKEAYKYRSIFLAKMYVKENCAYQITYQGKILNGIYRINNINFPFEGKTVIGTYRPEYFIATFKNGKREGKWKYFGSDFESIKNINALKSLSGNKNYSYVKEVVKTEIYKDGLPNGEWWQKSKDRVEYFSYKSGVLTNNRVKMIKK